jgi:hypothetical protein
MNNILAHFPEIQNMHIDKDEYRLSVTDNKVLHKCTVEIIARAFAMSQRRSEVRRNVKRRWWQRRRS